MRTIYGSLRTSFLELSILFLASALALGCGSSQPARSASAETASPPAPATGAEPADATEPTPAGPSFAELKAAVLACAVDEAGAIDPECEAYTNWEQNESVFEGGKSKDALLEMLASSDAKARFLAAERLRTTTDPEVTDAALVDAVLSAAEKERDERVVKAMAELCASLDLVKSRKLERAITIAKGHASPEFTEAFLFGVASTNRDPALVAWAREASRAKSSSVRNAALHAATYLAADHADDACKVIDALRADADRFVSNRATGNLGRTAKCSAHFDKLLDALAAVDVKKDVDQSVGFALDGICGHKGLGDKQRARANQAARRISEAPAVHVNTRFYTLSAVVACDAKDGKAYVAKFKTDKDKTIAARAAELTK